MELDEDFPEINAAPHIRFERFDRDDDLIIEFDNMFSNNGKKIDIFQDQLYYARISPVSPPCNLSLLSKELIDR